MVWSKTTLNETDLFVRTINKTLLPLSLLTMTDKNDGVGGVNLSEGKRGKKFLEALKTEAKEDFHLGKCVCFVSKI